MSDETETATAEVEAKTTESKTETKSDSKPSDEAAKLLKEVMALNGADRYFDAGTLFGDTEKASLFSPDAYREIQNRDSLNLVPLIEIPEEGINFQDVVTDMERELILQSLRKTNGNKKLAAKLLNLKRTTLIEKIKRIGLVEHMVASV